MALTYESGHDASNEVVFRGPSKDMPPAYLEEERGVLRFVIPNLNRETHLEQAGREVSRGMETFTCRDFSDPLQKSYPITISAEKTTIILRGLAHIADDKPHDPVLSAKWAGEYLDKLFGVSEDMTDNWFFRLCDREKEIGQDYN